jgi:hypothetical protein
MKAKNCVLEIKLFHNHKLIDNQCHIRVLYVTCVYDNGHFQSPKHLNNNCNSALNRISLNIKLLQTLMAEILFKKLGEHKTFQIGKNGLVYEQFKTCLKISNALKMVPKDLIIHLAYEISSKSDVFDKNCKYIAILSFTRYEPHESNILNDIFENKKGFCAIGAEWLAVYGTGSLYTWPEELKNLKNILNDDTSIDETKEYYRLKYLFSPVLV